MSTGAIVVCIVLTILFLSATNTPRKDPFCNPGEITECPDSWDDSVVAYKKCGQDSQWITSGTYGPGNCIVKCKDGDLHPCAESGTCVMSTCGGCKTNADCGEGTCGSDGVCICPANKTGLKCATDVQDLCTSDSQCSTDGKSGRCVQGLCVCGKLNINTPTGALLYDGTTPLSNVNTSPSAYASGYTTKYGPYEDGDAMKLAGYMLQQSENRYWEPDASGARCGQCIPNFGPGTVDDSNTTCIQPRFQTPMIFTVPCVNVSADYTAECQKIYPGSKYVGQMDANSPVTGGKNVVYNRCFEPSLQKSLICQLDDYTEFRNFRPNVYNQFMLDVHNDLYNKSTVGLQGVHTPGRPPYSYDVNRPHSHK